LTPARHLLLERRLPTRHIEFDRRHEHLEERPPAQHGQRVGGAQSRVCSGDVASLEHEEITCHDPVGSIMRLWLSLMTVARRAVIERTAITARSARCSSRHPMTA
jgi:hypothetical protein